MNNDDGPEFVGGQVYDPRISVALEKIAELTAALESASTEVDKLKDQNAELRQRMEPLELIKNCPSELRKSVRKEMVELHNLNANAIKKLEMDLKDRQPVKDVSTQPAPTDSGDLETQFKNFFKKELSAFEAKHVIKNWIKSELNAYQVNLIVWLHSKLIQGS